jgi:hypothetical protein
MQFCSLKVTKFNSTDKTANFTRLYGFFLIQRIMEGWGYGG